MIFAFSPAPRRETRIRGLFSHVRECLPLFRTGAKGVAAFMPRGSSAKRCTNATPIFFPEKENGRRPSKRKAFTLAVSISKSCTRCALHSRWQLCCLTDVAYPLRVIGCGVHGFAMNPYVSLPVSTAPYYCEARVTFARRQTTAYFWRRAPAMPRSAGKCKFAQIRSRRKLRKGSDTQAKRQRR